MKRFEYEKEYIRWKNDQLRLRKKYRDTPAGFTDKTAEEEMAAELEEAEARYRKRCTYEILSEYQPKEELFVGREKYLRLIGEKLQRGPVILYGIGGVGKSALAREYIRRCGMKYDHIIFLACRDDLRRAVCDDERLRISNLYYSERKYGSMLNYFKKKMDVLRTIAEEKRLLILIDDLNRTAERDRKAVFSLPCDILVTTRICPDIWGDHEEIRIKGLEEGEECERFIHAYQIGETMTEEMQAKLTSYSRTIQGHTLRLMFKIREVTGGTSEEEEAPDRDFEKDLFTHFPLKHTEKQILRELSVMPAQGIPTELYLKISGASGDDLNRLTEYLFVNKLWQDKEGEELLSLHPIVAEAAKRIFQPSLSNCRRLLWGIYDQVYDAWMKPLEENRKIEPYVLSLLRMFPEPEGWMMRPLNGLVTLLWIQEQYDTALDYAKKLMKSVESYYGEGHQNAGEMALRVAAAYFNMIDIENAAVWYFKGYWILEKCEPVNDAFYHIFALACGKLARICRYRQAYDKAFQFAEKAYENELIFEERSGGRAKYNEEDSGISKMLYTMEKVKVLLALGRVKEAEQMYDDIDLTVFGEEGSDFRINEFEEVRAVLLLQKGRYEEAENCCKEIVERNGYFRGDYFKNSLYDREKLADVYRIRGKESLAMQEYEAVLKGLIEEHPGQQKWIQRILDKMEG